MNASEQAAAVRRTAGFFILKHRGLIEVSGGDATRWLNGMLSNDILALEAAGVGAGCYALLLNHRAGIIADVCVLRREESYWLELELEFLPGVVEHLHKYIVADDVTLVDRSSEWTRFGLEGPAAPEILAIVAGCSVATLPAARAAMDITVSDVEAVAAAWGWSGEAAYQLFVPAMPGQAFTELLRSSAASTSLVEAGEDVLEILRVEAGVPRLGRELDEKVLPDEALLDEAISDTKGCYTGQEIVARLRSRGQVNHLLVGLCFVDADAPSLVGAELFDDARRVGEVTSVVHSATAGWVGLGFVRRTHAQAGTALTAAGAPVRVESLPLVTPAR